jgi:hypothetical protein
MNSQILNMGETKCIVQMFKDRNEKALAANDATETKPKFIAVKFPNSQFTIPFGVNDRRGVVGTYADSTGKMRGFLAKPNF